MLVILKEKEVMKEKFEVENSEVNNGKFSKNGYINFIC